MIERVAIIGTGLIGASIGLALKSLEEDSRIEVLGWDSKASELTRAVEIGAVDKALDAKMKAHKKGRAAAAAGGGSHSAKYKSQGFTTGGNKFDPLNANM